MLHFHHYNDPKDLALFSALVELYEPHDIAPVLHQALAGSGLQHVFYASDDSPWNEVHGAGILTTPEAAVPLKQGVNPLAWVISDVMTSEEHRRQGVASFIVEQMEKVVVRNGGRLIYLFTEEGNEAAKSLYGKVGFERLRNQGDHVVFAKLIKE